MAQTALPGGAQGGEGEGLLQGPQQSECPVVEPLTPSLYVGMGINQNQPKERNRGYLLRDCYIAREAASITEVGVETPSQKEEWESFVVRKGRVQVCPDRWLWLWGSSRRPTRSGDPM